MKLKSSLLALFLLLGALSLRADLASCLQGCDLDYSRKISILEPQYNQANLDLLLYSSCLTLEAIEIAKFNNMAVRRQPTPNEINEHADHCLAFYNYSQKVSSLDSLIKDLKDRFDSAEKELKTCRENCKE